MNQTTMPGIPHDSDAKAPFFDRRGSAVKQGTPVRERRQFTNSYEELSADAAELGQAIDEYKARHRRRFINYEEMLSVVTNLGYHR